MAKTFYTERDIEDLCRQGVRSITINDDVVMTELAREKAERLGVALVRGAGSPGGMTPQRDSHPPQAQSDLRQRVRDAVIARLGSEVDPALLDTIIVRVLDNVGVK